MQTSFLQTQEWLEFKKSQGWEYARVADVYVLSRQLFFGRKFLYAPEVKLKVLPADATHQALQAGKSEKLKVKELLFEIKPLLQNQSASGRIVFLRLELLDEWDDKIVKELRQLGFIKSFEEVQPEWRQVVGLEASEEEILAQMKPKGRYNIRVAQKHGVKVKESDDIDSFYQLYLSTAKRDKFSTRPKKYFEDLLKLPFASLWLATFQGEPIAAAIVIAYQKQATYLYGASSDEHRHLMAPYLLHWEIMRWSKSQECQSYDLLAISPLDKPNHKFAGLRRFKEQFGGRSVHLLGSWDLIFSPFWYKMFCWGEKVRRH